MWTIRRRLHWARDNPISSESMQRCPSIAPWAWSMSVSACGHVSILPYLPIWAQAPWHLPIIASQSPRHSGLHAWCITVPHIMVCLRYGWPYLQYDTSTHGNRYMNSRDFKSPLAGFSMHQACGSKYLMISMAFWTRLSAYSKFLSVLTLDLAIEYGVQSGDAQMTMKC